MAIDKLIIIVIIICNDGVDYRKKAVKKNSNLLNMKNKL
jgi:hypothetical protein